MTVSYAKMKAWGYYTDCMTPAQREDQESSASKPSGQRVDDYYSMGGKEPPGDWYVAPFANGQRTLFGVVDGVAFGAGGNVDDDVDRFGNLSEGFDPEGGRKLVQNAGEPERVQLHDFTFSAPKSVSVVSSQAAEETRAKIAGHQRDSVRRATDFFSEKAAWTRQGKAGTQKIKTSFTGGLFEHGSSRADDPQLHTHAALFNFGMRPNGTMGALEMHDSLQWRGAMASMYHASLAWGMRQEGFKVVVPDKDAPNRIFRIDGVPPEVEEAFSRRRDELVKGAVEQWKKENKGVGEEEVPVENIMASRGLLQQAAYDTRKAKNELTREELEEQWFERGEALGFTEREVRKLMQTGEPLEDWDYEGLLAEARKVVAELTEYHATFREPDLYTGVAIHLCGRASVDEIMTAVDAVREELVYSDSLSNRKENGAYDRAERVLSTREMLLIERDLIDRARKSGTEHHLDDQAVKAAIARRDDQIRKVAALDAKATAGAPDPKGLEQEQRAALLAVCTDNGYVSAIEGTAGAGKTFVARTVAEIYREAGYKVTGLAAGNAQAMNLKTEAALENGRAITGWLNDIGKGKVKLTAKSLIILDEAGMVGARQMCDVLAAAQDSGAKVVMMGDTLQQNAIAAGDALRVMVAEIGSSRLDTIRRQRDERDRAAVPLFFAGAADQALAHYLDQDRVHLATGQEATDEKLVSDWMASRARHVGKSHLIVASLNEHIGAINHRAHEARKAAGELGERSLRLASMGTKKDDLVEFTEKDEIVFRAADKKNGIFNWTRGTVVSIDEATERMNVLLDNGETIAIDPNDEQWQDKETGKIRIQLGYAVSVNASQGMTRDHSFVVDDVRMRRKQVGVAFSRHRDTCQVYVDREERHKSAMVRAEGRDWKSFERFTDGDCVRHMQKTYGREDNKESTLDYEDWQTHQGLPVHPEMDLLTRRIEELAKQKQSGRLMLELPFQRAPGYVLEDLPLSDPRSLREVGKDRLYEQGIDSRVIVDAKQAGFMSYKDGKPVFNGRRADGEIVNQVIDGKVAKGALRENFPPILRGNDDDIRVVAAGEDALALWSRADEQGALRPTVIVAAGKVRDALSLAHVQELLDNSKAAPSFHGRSIHPAERGAVERELARAARRDVRVLEEEESPTEERQRAAEAERQRQIADDESEG